MTLHDHSDSVTFRLSIQDGLEYKNEKEITVTSNQTELVALQIGALDISKGYKFIAEGVSGFIFKNESTLKIETKMLSIFIQTDKAIFKPGDSIKFRVLVLDYDLKAVTLAPYNQLNIYISDPEKNRIKQWLKVELTKGVFTSEMQLSELPLLGNWKIEAQVGKEIKTKEIEVAKYVLPTFDVSIDSSNDFSAKDGKIRAIIRSKYTYGKLVKGEAIVSLTQTTPDSIDGRIPDSILKTISINGKGTVEFDLPVLTSYPTYGYELKATVIEEWTNRNQTTSKAISIHKNRYKFNRIGLEENQNPFTRGSPLQFSVNLIENY